MSTTTDPFIQTVATVSSSGPAGGPTVPPRRRVVSMMAISAFAAAMGGMVPYRKLPKPIHTASYEIIKRTRKERSLANRRRQVLRAIIVRRTAFNVGKRSDDRLTVNHKKVGREIRENRLPLADVALFGK